jgi:hypothetical protein
LLTFKATLTSELTMPKDANFDITGNFVFGTTHISNFISLRNEKFKFSKTRIIFTPSQIKRFGDKLNADPICLNAPLIDNTYYTLLTTIIKDKTIYQVEIGDTNLKSKVTLHPNYIGTFKLKLVHDLIKIPSWLKTTLNKVFDKGLDAIFALIVAFTSYKAGEYNGKQTTKSDKPITSQVNDTTTLQKKAVHLDSNNFYKDNGKDTSHSVSYYKDTAKKQ